MRRNQFLLAAMILFACGTVETTRPTVASGSLSLEAFRSECDLAQSLLDDEENPRAALAAFQRLRGSLRSGPETDPYIAGLEIAILWVATAAADREAENQQLNLLRAMPNQPFVASEYKRSADGMTWRFWKTGFTRPETYAVPQEAGDAQVKAYEDLARRWGNLSWGREASGDGHSYGDIAVEGIYFNKTLADSDKLARLNALSEVLSGSAKGNYHFCASQLLAKRKELGKAEEHLRKCVDIYSNATGADSHHRDGMLDLCTEKLGGE